jgi:hypothetical protein
MTKTRTIAVVAGVLAALVMAIPSLAAPRDVNNDRIPDRWEQRHNLSLNVNQAPRDQDRDGLRNLREYRERTDPRDADSDGDGTDDATECNGGHRGPGNGPPPPPEEEPPVAP